MSVTGACIRQEIASAIFTFKAPRLIRVRSVKIGLLFRLAQFVVVGIIAFMMLYFKLYQKLDPAQGGVFTVVRGIADTRHRTVYRRVWDTAGFVIPPMEVDSVFVMTHVRLTNPDRAPATAVHSARRTPPVLLAVAFPSVVNSTASKISMFWLESASYRSNIIFILLALSLHCVSERYGHYYRMSGNILYRDLVKAYGTLLIFHIHGEGGKFNFINAMLTLGSIAAIFGVATVVCDFLFSYVFKVRAGYQKRKCADLFEDDIKKLLEKMETKQVADDKLPPEPSSFHPPKAPIVKARTAKSAAEMSKVLKC